jgi:hypothetical protein
MHRSSVEVTDLCPIAWRGEVDNIDLQPICGWRSISSTLIPSIVGNLPTILRRLGLLHWAHQWMIFGRVRLVAKNAYYPCYVGQNESARFHLHEFP